jgi:hypothetical protein
MNGPLFAVGVSSASATFRRAGRIGRYNLFTITQTNAGWRIHMRSRAIGEDGGLVETDHGLLTLAAPS